MNDHGVLLWQERLEREQRVRGAVVVALCCHALLLCAVTFVWQKRREQRVRGQSHALLLVAGRRWDCSAAARRLGCPASCWASAAARPVWERCWTAIHSVQETDRRLREEQDAEYQRSLEADRQVRS